jgi:hypothetical protein
MSSAIKAIETVYNGYRFRSRTEARWAVFFDALGLQYEYELEGFELSDQWKYLPDFYLPQFIASPAFVEVKGVEPSADEMSKAILLNQQSKEDVLIFVGIPDPKNISTWITSRSGDLRIIKGHLESVFTSIDALSRPKMKAYDAACIAKQARFEYGETPQTFATPQTSDPIKSIKNALEKRSRMFLVVALESARKVVFEKDELYIEFAPSATRLRDILAKPESVKTLRDVGREVLGRDIGIRIVIGRADERLNLEREAELFYSQLLYMGVHLKMKEDKLHVSAPAGVLTEGIKASIERLASKLMARLKILDSIPF